MGEKSTFPQRFAEMGRDFEGLQLGYAGIELGQSFAIDAWIKSSFDLPRFYAFAHGNRHMPPGRSDKNGATWIAEWTLGVDGPTNEFVLHMVPPLGHGQPRVTRTGFNVMRLSASDWHRLTISVMDGQMTIYLNGTQTGMAPVPLLGPVSVMGNGCHADLFMQCPWHTLYDVHICAGVPIQQQMANEQRLGELMAEELKQVKNWETHWMAHLRGKSIVLVGNSAKILQKPQGSTIDSHDVVIRFNAVQAPEDKFPFLGRKVDFLVLGDLTQLCNCHSGTCCNGAHAHLLFNMLPPGDNRVGILWARKTDPPAAFQAAINQWSNRTQLLRLNPKKHFEDAMNAYLDYLQTRMHPGITHRIPAIMPFRTGFRIIAGLLFNELEFHVIGFDLNEERNPLYNGKETSGAEGKYVAETRVLYDMLQAGMFKSYT